MALRRLAPAACALLLALLLPAAAEAAPAISLERASDDALVYTASASGLTGRLTGVTFGNGNRAVALRASAFPYRRETTIDSTTTDGGGGFSFEVEPDLNTRYRAVFNGGPLLGSATSPAARAFVYAKSRFRLRVRRNRALARWRLRYSPDLNPNPLSGTTVRWYFRKVRQSHFRRVARSAFWSRFPRDGVTTRVRYRLPRSRRAYRFEFMGCIPKPRGDYGVGDRRRGRCPKRIPVRRRAAAASASADDGAGGPVIVGRGVAGG